MRTCAAIRSSGLAPSAGSPNASASTSFLASSIVVPSRAVTSRPFHRIPSPGSASLRAASSSNRRFMTCSPSSLRACENALPTGTCVPGLNRKPGSPNAVAKAPGRRNGHRQPRPTRTFVSFQGPPRPSRHRYQHAARPLPASGNQDINDQNSGNLRAVGFEPGFLFLYRKLTYLLKDAHFSVTHFARWANILQVASRKDFKVFDASAVQLVSN